MPHRAFTLTVEFEAGHLVVAVVGELDAMNTGALPVSIAAAVGGFPSVRVDMSRVSFIDASGLRALMICEAAMARDGVDFRVRRPAPVVHRLMQAAHLTYLLEDDAENHCERR